MVELLTVVVIIGILSAIMLYISLNKQSRGHDADAKLTAVVASKAMEICGSEKDSSYADCSKGSLEEIEPALKDAAPRISLSSGARDYEIVVTSKRDPAVRFILSRATTGTAIRSCSTGSADKGGCSAQSGGSW